VTSRRRDIAVLGGGSGGYATAIRAADLGLDVALIDDGDVGGTCLHRGCIPTKALLHSAEVADTARTAGQFGVDTLYSGVDIDKVHHYKDTIVTRLHKGLRGLIDGHAITVVPGRGRLVDAHTIDVEGTLIEADNVVLATGSVPRAMPAAMGDRVITSDEALVLPFVPRDVVIIGGGVIGLEFASIWASFGANVTIVEVLPRLLPGEDETISTYVERAFRRRKIKALTNATIVDITQTADSATVDLGSGASLTADIVLVAIGRVPNTSGLGYEEAGVQVDRGFVVTDENLRTTRTNVYAVGDIVAGLQLAHRGFQHGLFVAETIAGAKPAPIDETGIPRVTYCTPEVASVGLTEAVARRTFGEDVRAVTYDLAGNGKSQILKTQGVVKLVLTPTGVVAGIHMVGDHVGELVGEAQLLYNTQASAADVSRFVHAHPTQGEALGEVLMVAAGKPLHAHR
jgi:dihydrolipoamide dehydrogenase